MRTDPPERTFARTGASPRTAGAGSTVALRLEERESDTGREAEVEGELLYWRSRARELEAQVAAMRARMLALAEHLPAALAPLIGSDPESLSGSGKGRDPLEDWEETTLLKPSSVALELPRLWERLRWTREL